MGFLLAWRGGAEMSEEGRNNRHRFPWEWLTISMGILLLIQGLTLWVPYDNFFKRLEWMSLDQRIRWATRVPEPTPNFLGGVFIDDTAVDQFNNGSLGVRYKFPNWPRSVYGRIIRELKAQGATAVGVDILLDQVDPCYDHDVLLLETGEEVGHDAFLAYQMEMAGNVVLATDGEIFPAKELMNKAVGLGHISVPPDSVLRRIRPFITHTRRIWNSEIEYVGRAMRLDLEHPEFFPDRIEFYSEVLQGPHAIGLLEDGSLDVMALTGEDSVKGVAPFTIEEERIWHLGLALAMRYLGLNPEEVEVLPGGLRLGNERWIPLDRDGYAYIDWVFPWEAIKQWSQDTVKSLVVQDVARQTEGEWFVPTAKGKLMFIGSTATGNNITDQGETPLESRTMLVITHFNTAYSLIKNRFIQPYSPLVESTMILLFGLLGSFLTWRMRILGASFWVVFLLVCYVIAISLGFTQTRYWFPMVLPCCALMISHVGMVTNRVRFEQREQRRVKSIFSKVVSPEVVNELLTAEKLDVEGARRRVTVLFADIRGFTQFAEMVQERGMQAVREQGLEGEEAEWVVEEQSRETLRTVNLYLSVIADHIKQEQGTLDKYMGDCVMAFWGAPADEDRHAARCVRAAIRAQQTIQKMNRERESLNQERMVENEQRKKQGESLLPLLPILSCGTGINSGMVTVGLMGSDRHILNYTVFGREVNLASRLEGVSGSGRIIVGLNTWRELKRTDPELAEACQPLPLMNLKGISHRIQAYEVPWEKELAP